MSWKGRELENTSTGGEEKGTGGKGRGAEGEESCMEGNGEELERSRRGWELVGR